MFKHLLLSEQRNCGIIAEHVGSGVASSKFEIGSSENVSSLHSGVNEVSSIAFY
jgi:hypothetical protein